MTTIATLVIDLGANVARLRQDMNAANRVVGREFSSMRRQAQSFRAAFEGVLLGSGFALFGRQALAAAKESEQAGNRIIAVLHAQGAAATIAKREIDQMADELMELTQFDDESIRNGAATLLKFGNIHGEVFSRAMKLAADYAAFTGSSFQESAQVVGKALQAPIEGMGMLERQIGKLTPEQDKMLRKFVEGKKGIEAQSAVLDILQGKIGGTAERMNSGLTKAIEDIKKQWDELMESLGKTERGERSLSGLASIFKDLRATIEGVRNPLQQLMLDTADFIDEWLKFSPLAFTSDKLRALAVSGGRTKTGQIRWKETGRPVGEKVAPRPGNVTLGGDDKTAGAADRLMQRYQDKLRQLGAEASRVFGEDSAVNELRLLLSTDKDWKKLGAAQREALLAAAGRVDAEKTLALLLKQNAEASEQEARDYSEAWSFVPQMQQQLRGRERFENIFGEDALVGKSLEEIQAWYQEYLKAIDAATEIAEEGMRVYAGFNEAGTEYLGVVKKTDDFWRDLGLTMSSALEDLVFDLDRSKKAGDLLKATLLDIGRMWFRTNVTKPGAELLNGLFQGGLRSLFSGGEAPPIDTAEGGARAAGDLLWVGERGPELWVPETGGRMIPNHDLRSAFTDRGGAGDTYFIDAKGADAAGLARLERLIQRLGGRIDSMPGDIAELAGRSVEYRRALAGA